MKFDKEKYHISQWIVPLVFITLCAIGIIYSGRTPSFIINNVLERMGRNCFLVIALIIPIIAGIGLNFSIVVGAMAAQIALIFIVDWGISGGTGIIAAFALSTIPAIIFGYLVGRLFNRAQGREMVTGLITGFFSNGIYQLIFLFGAGSVFSIYTKTMLLPRGENPDGTKNLLGLRNTIDLSSVQYTLDDFLKWEAFKAFETDIGVIFPLFTFFLIALGCLFVVYFKKTKIGQEMKAMGNNLHIAEVSGINVKRNRIIATIISTVMAAWGQIIFLQNMGTINTYNSHEQVGMFAIAALLVSGATVSKATIWNALFGTLLFHTLFLTSPLAGNNLFGEAQLGEYFRVFIAYGVIAVALALHAWKGKRKKA